MTAGEQPCRGAPAPGPCNLGIAGLNPFIPRGKDGHEAEYWRRAVLPYLLAVSKGSLAQLARAFGFYPKGSGFDSLAAYGLVMELAYIPASKAGAREGIPVRVGARLHMGVALGAGWSPKPTGRGSIPCTPAIPPQHDWPCGSLLTRRLLVRAQPVEL